MTAFDQMVNSFEQQHSEVQKCSSLTGLQSIRIWQSEIDGYQYIGELLSPALKSEIDEHPSTTLGADICTTNFELAKMYYQDAEIAITSEYAYRIYLAVKSVMDKGDQLT